jgi:hypothetical protein
MKKILILITYIITFQTAEAQLIFTIEELHLTNYNVVEDTTMLLLSEHLWNGPTISVTCSIKNVTDDTITLHPKKSAIEVIFRHNNTNHYSSVFPVPFLENETLAIHPNQTIDFWFWQYLLIGTDIIQPTNYYNYTNDLLQIVSTIKIMYREKGIKLQTQEIKNVILHPSLSVVSKQRRDKNE